MKKILIIVAAAAIVAACWKEEEEVSYLTSTESVREHIKGLWFNVINIKFSPESTYADSMHIVYGAIQEAMDKHVDGEWPAYPAFTFNDSVLNHYILLFLLTGINSNEYSDKSVYSITKKNGTFYIMLTINDERICELKIILLSDNKLILSYEPELSNERILSGLYRTPYHNQYK